MAEHPAAPISERFDLSGRTALVTGASGHLGIALASGLAEASCRVVAASRNLEKARQTAARLGGAQAGRHGAVAIDHLDEASAQRGFEDAVRQAGRIDILVNNGHHPLAADWRTVTGDEFTRQLANATGYFLLARLLRDHAVQNSCPASIILLGSMYGQVGSYPEVYEGVQPASPAAYHALKGGIVHLTRHLAVYWAKDRVRVNCLSPGPFPASGVPAELVRRIEARSPMGRIGQPDELKGAVVFLASDASSYVTGHNLVVDGGWTAW
ncbi:MAG: SDR family oxidoreductase [Verrucomicrobia bacterium]|nr:SDR family oxidoreductase [Verrucomicrobiota bacterium]